MKGTVKRLRDTKVKIIGYLKTHKKREIYKDSDEALAARYWSDELLSQGWDTKGMNVYDFFVLYSSGKLTPAGVIERSRRKAQEECSELRGSKWLERHGAEAEVRDAVVNDKI